MRKNSSAPKKGFSLNAKICTLATGLAVLSLAVTAAVIGYKNTEVSEEGTLKQVQTSTQALASKLETRISANFSAVSSLAQAVQSTQGSGASLSREQIADLVKATLTGSEDFIGAAVTMEPNALDGKDSEYASKSAWYDATGRYMPYWTKSAGGNLHVDPIVFDSAPGANDWYDIPKKTSKVYFTEPYIYPIEGKDVMMASLVAPIIVKGNFQGVASADFTLSQLNKLMNSVQTIEGSSLSLISNGGMYVANDDASLVNKKVEDLSEEALQHVKNGTSYVFVDKSAGVITLLEPVRSHANAAPWSVRVSFPLAAATAVSRELLMYTIAVSLVCAVLAAIALFAGINRLMSPVRKLAEAMKGLADGTQGLSARLAETGTDELSEIAKGFNAFVSKIQSVIATVKTNADSVSLASAEISAGNNNLSARTESQASALQQTAASMEELSSQVKLNAQNSEQASTLATQATAVATKGGKAVTDVVETMKDINESSRKIAEIISVIDGIAFQTNILALNASVEAARAGEQGRGFAVVASEVRNLAGRSAQAAKEIKDLITASVTHVQKGTEQVGAAGATIGEVVASIKRVSDLVSEISVASKEQAQGVAQVGEAVTQMDEATQQNAALVEEMAAAAGSLNTQATELVTAVASFGGAPQGLPTLKAPAPVERLTTTESRRVALAPAAPDRVKASTLPVATPVGNETDWETF